MKRNKRTTIAMSLAALMLAVSVTGCTQPTSSSSSTGGTSSGVSSETASKASGDRVKIGIVKVDTGSVFREDSIVHAAIEDATNLDINLMLLPDSEVVNKINTMAASNSLPDIVSYKDYYPYAKQGLLMDIGDLVNEHGPDLKKHLPENLWDYTTYQDKVVAIPYLNDAGKYVMSVRQDWIDKLQLKVPTNLDELYDVAVAFATKDPDGNGKADSYGFSTWTDMMPVFGAYGITPHGTNSYFADNDKVYPSMASAQYKEVLAYANRLWEAKAIDPDIFVMNQDQQRMKTAQGKIGMGTEWWSIIPQVVMLQLKFEELNPDGKWSIMKPVTGPGGPLGNAGMQSNGDYQGACWISANSKNPVEAIKLLNWLITDEGYIMAGEGIEDVHYTWKEDGTREITEEGAAARDEKWRDAMSQIIGKRLDISNATVYLPTDDVAEARRRSYVVAGLEGYPLYANLTLGLPATDAELSYNVDLLNFETDSRVAFVTGERSLDEYDAYVQEWMKRGGKDVLQSKIDQLNEMRGTSYTSGL